ncbi:MAG: hypothetical protein DMD41_14055 [Gemmatimonadetes bacterium]|nr:MAG: hypothetical protein DMD41_14055 [Gemmatimonadota bacterium]
MKAARPLVVVLLVCALALASACGDRQPTAPQPPAPSADLIGSLLHATGLLSCSNLPYDSTTQTIGPAGGSLSVGPHTLVIPRAALKQSVSITMILPTGLRVNAVKFKPAGLQFQTPAALTMSYANCSLLGKLLPKRIAYKTDNLQILYYLLSLDNLLSKYVTGKVNHFSDYVIAW